MSDAINPSSMNASNERNDEVSLLDLIILFAKYKTLIIALPIVAAVLAAGYSLTLPDIYTANTKILPPQQSQSTASAVLAQLGGLAGLAGGAVKSPNDIYVAMLRSRTLADSMIRRFELMKLWEVDADHPSDAYKGLAEITKISAEKDGTISIEVEDKDPKRAAGFANAYVEELVKLTSQVVVTEASQRRLFFERQLALARDNLFKAEVSARQALQTTGLVKVDEQGRAMVEATARLRGQITVKDVQIGVMRTYAADRNPDLQLALQELVSLKRELAKIEGTGEGRPATQNPGGQSSDSLRLLRDVKYQETIYELLARQYELAKVDEAKDSTLIQVLDKAIEPDRKSKPSRRQIVMFSAIIMGFLTVLAVFAKEALAGASNDPVQLRRLQTLRSYLSTK